MSFFNLQVLISLVDRLSGPLQEPIQRLQQLQEQSERVDRSMRMMQTGAGLAGAGAVMAAPLVVSAREAINFEDKMAEVRKVMDELENPKAFAEMGADITRLSNDIPMLATDLAEIGSFAAASKLEPSREGVLRMIEDSAKMGVAFDMTAEEAGSALAGMRSIFEMSEKQVVKLGDAVNYLGNNTSARARDMVNFLSRAGAVGKQVGLTAQQTAALGNAFLVLKTPPEIAARAVTQALIPSLQTATRQGKKFEQAANLIGLSAQQIQDGMRMDAQGTILDVLDRVSRADNKMLVLTDMFGVGFADDIAKLAGSMGVYRKALGLVGDESKYAGSMEKEYQGRINTTKTQLMLLKNGIFNIAGAMGDVYLPLISRAAKFTQSTAKAIFEWTQRNPLLVRAIMYSALVISLLTMALGGTILAMGVFGFATANASAGLIILKGQLAAAQVRVLALRNALIARVTGGWIPSTAAQMAMFGGATSLNQIALMGLKQALLQATRAAWAFIAPILANPITWLVVGVLALAGAFVYFWRTSETFRNGISQIFAPLTEAWAGVRLAWVQLMTVFSGGNPALDSQAKDLSRWGSMWRDLVNFVIYWAVYLLTFISLIAGDIALTFVNSLSGLITFIAGAFNIIKGIFTGDMTLIQLGLQQAGAGIQAIWDNSLLKPLVAGVYEWGPAIMEGFGAAMNELWAMGAQWLQVGQSWMSSLWQGIKGKWSEFADGAKNLGWNIVEGITGGLIQNPNAATAAGAAADSVTRTVKGKWDINSPSRVFMGLGSYAMQGLTHGIQQGTLGALGATKRMAAGVVGAAALSIPGVALASVSAQEVDAATSMAPATASLQVQGSKENAVAVESKQSSAGSTLSFAGATIVFQMPEGSTQDQLAAFAALLQSLRDQ